MQDLAGRELGIGSVLKQVWLPKRWAHEPCWTLASSGLFSD